MGREWDGNGAGMGQVRDGELNNSINIPLYIMKDDTDMKCETIVNYIDTKVAGEEIIYRKLDVPSFVAGFLQQIITDFGFETDFHQLRQKILHLSFLVHLVCRFEDFNKVYEEYKSVQEDLSSGNISWSDEQYFREWEEAILNRDKKFRDQTKDNSAYNSKDEKFSEENLSEQKYEDFDPAICISFRRPKRKYDSDVKEDKKNYKCHECDFKWTSKKCYLKHLFEKHGQKTCPYCDNIEDVFEQYWSHLLTHKNTETQFKKRPERETISCEDCDFLTTSNKNYQKHLFEKHENNLCTDCGLAFDEFKAFLLHQQTHGSGFMCDICSTSFISKRTLEHHRRKDHNKNNHELMKEVCPQCGISVSNVKNHIRRKHGEEGPALQCSECEFSTNYKRDFDLHFEARHTTKLVQNCPYCNKVVKGLKKHLATVKCHLPEEERKKFIVEVKCDVCDKVFSSHEKVRKHLKRVHTDVQYNCELCSFQTKHIGNLKHHIRTVHEKKPLKEICPFCDKTCTNLDWHVQTYHQPK